MIRQKLRGDIRVPRQSDSGTRDFISVIREPPGLLLLLLLLFLLQQLPGGLGVQEEVRWKCVRSDKHLMIHASSLVSVAIGIPVEFPMSV